ncbi:MAG: NADH-quinone oxidoreductase subunit C [Desulfobacterales bacterium]|nr:NADH-quinone oxidoreductase subunit C [Desulfobacterales bacterium]MCF8080544.1 NADH-quinone oxidoreductase subunit C [Desulfobacterales bacterium]
MLESTSLVDADRLHSHAGNLKENGWRLVGMTGVAREGGVDLFYHFDRELKMTNLKVETEEDETIPSIGDQFPGAWIHENEIQDQFGIRFDGLDPDYRRLFFLEENVEATPICRGVSARVSKEPGK